jgi:hypothetical protein
LYGNDFFGVPLTTPVGSVTHVLTLEVLTTFGDTIEIPSTIDYDLPSQSDRWRMYHCDNGYPDNGDGAGHLVTPPAALDVMQGREVEDVLFTRDEMANVAWAVERRVRGPLGTPVERREVEHARSRGAGLEPVVENALHYRLSTTMPDFWMALIPIAGDGLLERQSLTEPAGQLLAGKPFHLDSVELPRIGRRVTLNARRSRAADGSVLVWWAWEAGPGNGESSSGLRFDDLTHEQPH